MILDTAFAEQQEEFLREKKIHEFLEAAEALLLPEGRLLGMCRLLDKEFMMNISVGLLGGKYEYLINWYIDHLSHDLLDAIKKGDIRGIDVCIAELRRLL